jgi:serine/threonine-protein kinase
MALGAHQRPITTVVLGLMILGLLVACGAAEKSSTPVAAAPSSSAARILGAQPQAAPPSPVRQTNASGADRLGCGTTCQSAGGYGAPEDEGVDAIMIRSSGTVPLDPDGYVPLTVTCNLPVPCTGEILACARGLSESLGFALSCGRSDEEVGPNATRTLGIALPTPVLGVVRAQGPTSVHFTVATSRTPLCEDIPQLAAQCAAAFPTNPNHATPEGIIRFADADLVVVEPASGFGAQFPGDNAASRRQLDQIAADDRPFVASDLADHWVPQLSSKRPGTVDDGFTWDDTLILDEHQRLRDRYGAKLVWSGDWTSFDTKDVWVTIAPMTFPDAKSALTWCLNNGLGVNYCAAKLVSATHPPHGTFAHQ